MTIAFETILGSAPRFPFLLDTTFAKDNAQNGRDGTSFYTSKTRKETSETFLGVYRGHDKRWHVGECRTDGIVVLMNSFLQSAEVGVPRPALVQHWEYKGDDGNFVGTTLRCKDVVVQKEETDDDVQIVGERTREDRDREGRAKAIDVDTLDLPPPESRNEDELRARVDEARKRCFAAIHKKVRRDLSSSIQDFVEDKIDGSELERRKVQKKDEAMRRSKALRRLDDAYAKYKAARPNEREDVRLLLTHMLDVTTTPA